jgi:hypothetical protein
LLRRRGASEHVRVERLLSDVQRAQSDARVAKHAANERARVDLARIAAATKGIRKYMRNAVL